uniref:Uncharacterized protein n=1 Tax=Chromera velia CCMP2878 TaxID=1169474 RepID=A0A0G4FMJ8_9ALVE|eukprot:Cvel_17754.t1-p1 / transcript=Cvel_17754.t1 / gene=Cvel_17754 / organism=Chromera_velia_CCMP2878 / gene_product=hypothetical protein / transcript_product=hypothetical protein / location=Cvel_scaffold1435:228-1949(-) / protein_length=217 / sequence_SO=supercontig / SO=protein_coding / is_pseudo=false
MTCFTCILFFLLRVPACLGGPEVPGGISVPPAAPENDEIRGALNVTDRFSIEETETGGKMGGEASTVRPPTEALVPVEAALFLVVYGYCAGVLAGLTGASDASKCECKGQNDDGCADQSRVVFRWDGGTDAHVLVRSYGSLSSKFAFLLTMSLSLEVPPPNDEAVNATDLTARLSQSDAEGPGRDGGDGAGTPFEAPGPLRVVTVTAPSTPGSLSAY